MMLQQLRDVIGQYAAGQIDLPALEDWIVAHLQSILDSGDAQAIDLANEFDALFIELGESLITEDDLFERASAMRNQMEIVRFPIPVTEEFVASTSTSDKVVKGNPVRATIDEVHRRNWAPA